MYLFIDRPRCCHNEIKLTINNKNTSKLVHLYEISNELDEMTRMCQRLSVWRFIISAYHIRNMRTKRCKRKNFYITIYSHKKTRIN